MEDGNFPLFPRFPLEIQSMIWVASMEPRKVEITMALGAGDRPGQRRVVMQVTPNPPQMVATQEARKAYLQYYTKMYVSYPQKLNRSARSRVIYLHPGLDVVSQDFQVIVTRQGNNRIRAPGAPARSLWQPSFCDALTIAPPQVNLPLVGVAAPLGIVPWLTWTWRKLSSSDPLGSLRHVQVNIHVVVSSRRHPAGTQMETTTRFVQGLMHRSQHTQLQTITLRITRDLSSPPSPAVLDRLRPLVFRIVRSQPLPIRRPNMVFSGIKAEMHLAELRGEQPVRPSLLDVLAADAAIFNLPSTAAFIALRVIDTKSLASEYDDAGRHWPGAEREKLLFDMLDRSSPHGYQTVATWLTQLLDFPQMVLPLQGKHWGLCGAHYGLGPARGIERPTGLVDWPWH